MTTLDKLHLLFVPAAISLGHEHDLRVKHLSDALSDKHGPAAGKYWLALGTSWSPLLPSLFHVVFLFMGSPET